MSDLVDLLERLFGPIPSYVLWAALGIALVSGFLKAIPFLVKEIIPIFYSPENARRRNRRRRFAEHIEHELRRLNSMEEWSDYRFTELEAEVEAEGRRRSKLFPFLIKRDVLRRERSLTKALENSTERLMLLEGAPGSGKSVALRHLALKMVRKAMRSRNLTTVIPIYVNLKSLKREIDQQGNPSAVDVQLIRDFVIQTLNRANDRDVAAFLDDEFQLGLGSGTWLFLFDSFDEIPDILSSTEADPIIRLYAQALSDFLHGMNQCRGIIASREYRGPRYLTWPKFRIMPLSSGQQEGLIKRAELSTEAELSVFGGLQAGSQSTRQLAENPMFLGLLCEFVRVNHHYPEHDFAVYDAYIASRFARDESRLQHRYGLSLMELRTGAESVAFCMLSDSKVGLSATLEEIETSLRNHAFDWGFETRHVLDALQFIKLAKADDDLLKGQRTFTFSHRRLQESLATMILLREPERVNPIELLTNGIWRESAVVLLQQTKSEAKLEPLIQTGVQVVALMSRQILTGDEVEVDNRTSGTNKADRMPKPFPWPSGLRHVLKLLQEGLLYRPELVPDILHSLYTLVITTVWNPRKWLVSDIRDALAVAGLLPQDLLADILTLGVKHPSQRIRDEAYHQAANLRELHEIHVDAIRSWLVEMYEQRRLRAEHRAVTAMVMRLDQSKHLLDVVRFLRAVPYLALLLGSTIIFLTSVTFLSTDSATFRATAGLVLLTPFVLKVMGSRVASKQVFFVLAVLISLGLIAWLWIRSDIASPRNVNLLYFYLLGYGYFYSILGWPTSAMALARRGRFIRPYEWPIALLVPAFQIPLLISRSTVDLAILMAKEVVADFRNSWSNLISTLGVVRALLVTLVIMIFVGVVTWFLLSEAVPNGIKLVANLLFLSLVPVFMVFQMMPEVRNAIQDHRVVKDISKRSKPITGEELLGFTSVLHSNESRLRFIRLIREHNLVPDSPYDVSLMTMLASQLQHDLLEEKEETGLNTGPPSSASAYVSTPFDAWYYTFLQRQRVSRPKRRVRFGLAELGWEFLDEVILLLEETREHLEKTV